MCVCVCVCVYMCVCACVHVRACVRVHVHACVSIAVKPVAPSLSVVRWCSSESLESFRSTSEYFFTWQVVVVVVIERSFLVFARRVQNAKKKSLL